MLEVLAEFFYRQRDSARIKPSPRNCSGSLDIEAVRGSGATDEPVMLGLVCASQSATLSKGT